jgi:ubiquinone/menaquinone biosynthesis C-methylase UbiE
MDEWLPPILREAWPFPWLTKIWLGPRSRPDFKSHAFRMSESEYLAAYEAVSGAYGRREADTTEEQRQWLLDRVGSGREVLEIGPGQGALTQRLVERGLRLTTLDVQFHRREMSVDAVMGLAERLPFGRKTFDVTIICMVLEHVRSLTSTFLELERVTKDRVLIITPRQRFYKVTFDYHLHFFYSLDHLASHAHAGSTEGRVIDGDLCLEWRMPPAPTSETDSDEAADRSKALSA